MSAPVPWAAPTVSSTEPVSTADFHVRAARPEDIPGIARVLDAYAERGLLLPRSNEELRDTIADFAVCEHDGLIVGTGAVHRYTAELGEIRSVAVREGCQRHGLGGRLVGWVEAHAHTLGLRRVFALTYRVRFFERLGYSRVPRATLPEKVWGDCARCPKAEFCDEVAVEKPLAPVSHEDTAGSLL